MWRAWGVAGPWCVDFMEDAHATPWGPLWCGHIDAGRMVGGGINNVLHTLQTLHTERDLFFPST